MTRTELLKEIPELAFWLASNVIPSAEAGDGLPRARTVTRTPFNDYAVDQLGELMDGLNKWAIYWNIELSMTGAPPTVVARYHDVVADNPDRAYFHAQAFVNVILNANERLTDDVRWEQVDEFLTETVAPIKARMHGRIVQQKPRKCAKCGAMDVWAQVTDGSALCGSCKNVAYLDKWCSIRDAADILNVNVRTIYNWIKSGEVDGVTETYSSGQKGATVVRLAQCRKAHEDNLARKKAGKKNVKKFD